MELSNAKRGVTGARGWDGGGRAGRVTTMQMNIHYHIFLMTWKGIKAFSNWKWGKEELQLNIIFKLKSWGKNVRMRTHSAPPTIFARSIRVHRRLSVCVTKSVRVCEAAPVCSRSGANEANAIQKIHFAAEGSEDDFI